MMAAYALINTALIAVGVLHPRSIGAGAILLTSFFMSIMFPTIFTLGVKGLSPRTKLASSLIVTAVVGAAVLPPILGLVAKHFGSYACGYAVVAACYVVVAIYGYRASSEPCQHNSASAH